RRRPSQMRFTRSIWRGVSFEERRCVYGLASASRKRCDFNGVFESGKQSIFQTLKIDLDADRIAGLQTAGPDDKVTRDLECITKTAAEICCERKCNGENEQSVDRKAARNALPLLCNTGDLVVGERIVDPFGGNTQRNCSGGNGIGAWHSIILYI